MKVIAKNRRAKADYAIERRMIAGIVLKGHEVKSVRSGDVSLKGAFASIHNGELYIHNMHIGPYKNASNLESYEPTATRKLLVSRKELSALIAEKQNGRYIVPLAIGAERRFLKVELGIGSSQKRRDKRDTIKTRETNIDIQRSLHERNK